MSRSRGEYRNLAPRRKPVPHRGVDGWTTRDERTLVPQEIKEEATKEEPPPLDELEAEWRRFRALQDSIHGVKR